MRVRAQSSRRTTTHACGRRVAPGRSRAGPPSIGCNRRRRPMDRRTARGRSRGPACRRCKTIPNPNASRDTAPRLARSNRRRAAAAGWHWRACRCCSSTPNRSRCWSRRRNRSACRRCNAKAGRPRAGCRRRCSAGCRKAAIRCRGSNRFRARRPPASCRCGSGPDTNPWLRARRSIARAPSLPH